MTRQSRDPGCGHASSDVGARTDNRTQRRAAQRRQERDAWKLMPMMEVDPGRERRCFRTGNHVAADEQPKCSRHLARSMSPGIEVLLMRHSWREWGGLAHAMAPPKPKQPHPVPRDRLSSIFWKTYDEATARNGHKRVSVAGRCKVPAH